MYYFVKGVQKDQYLQCGKPVPAVNILKNYYWQYNLIYF